jgi:hypothetical protein
MEGAWQRLTEAHEELRRACMSGREFALRDSCIVLTQVFAAYHPDPELTWLGLPDHLALTYAEALRQRVSNARSLETVDRIAQSL